MEALFETFGINWQLLLMQAVNFAIVLGVLWWFLWRPLLKLLDARKAMIAKGVEDAAAAAHAKQEIEGQKAGIIAGANKEAEAVVARATDAGKKERAEIVKVAQDRAEATLRDAELQALEAKRRALKESEKEIAQTAILAAEKILQKS